MPFRTIVYCCLLAFFAGCATPKPVNKSPEAYLKDGEELYKNKKYEESITQWKKVKEYGAASPLLAAIADLKIADAQFESKNYIEAAASYESFSKFHPNSERVPYALYRLGLCNFNQVTGYDTDQTPVKNAINMFESFLKQYPSSEFADDVRQKLADCITQQVRYEIYIGRFYLRFGKYQASIKHLEECVARYPQSQILDEALLYLEKAYLLNNEKAKGRETFNRLFIKFPTSKYIKEANNYLKKYE